MTECNGTKLMRHNSISLTFWTIFFTENIRYPFNIFRVMGIWGTKYLKEVVFGYLYWLRVISFDKLYPLHSVHEEIPWTHRLIIQPRLSIVQAVIEITLLQYIDLPCKQVRALFHALRQVQRHCTTNQMGIDVNQGIWRVNMALVPNTRLNCRPPRRQLNIIGQGNESQRQLGSFPRLGELVYF